MPIDTIFRVANTLALGCWLALLCAPGAVVVRRLVLGIAVGAMGCLYAALIGVWFFRVPGGGFGTLAAVQRLFESAPVALAGWLHFLAFDLFVGTWIAQRSAAAGVSRWILGPILAVTFMFGPLGLLLHCAREFAARLRPRWAFAA